MKHKLSKERNHEDVLERKNYLNCVDLLINLNRREGERKERGRKKKRKRKKKEKKKRKQTEHNKCYSLPNNFFLPSDMVTLLLILLIL